MIEKEAGIQITELSAVDSRISNNFAHSVTYFEFTQEMITFQNQKGKSKTFQWQYPS